jgi:hypothetical protein
MDNYGNGDSFRDSKELTIKRTEQIVKYPMPQFSDGEAYNRQGVPDGLLTDGKQPQFYGKVQKETHDAAGFSTDSPIQHNSDAMAGAHPGFAAVQNSIEKKEGYSKESAGAILASAARKASARAKQANPKLDKVDGQ